MKVSVITRHAVTNYGSLLQALATQTILERLGHESELIDYIRDDESYQKHEITLLKRKPNWYNNPLKRMVYLTLRQPESILAGQRFEKERIQLLHLSKKYTSKESLQLDPPIADIYMTGSDQVWGPSEDGEHDSSYCLSFVGSGAKKISYAASFGHTDMTNETKGYFKKWLSEYKQISVREDSAVQLLDDLGFKAKQVIDPTLLMTRDEWSQYITKEPKGRYVLVYQLHNDDKLGEYAQKVAKAMGLPLLRVSASFHQITRPGKFVWCPKMGEFLGYIKNAECLITDSFHGTAFAINFNTSFVEVLPNNNTGTRNMSILKLTGLSDRILKNNDDIALAMKTIDFTKANEVIQNQRVESIKIMRDMIENE